ncbi:bifunctional hydroxymethylpyrimidine kinase/phosphomethylpyrimidine kinase [Paenibacillus apiarius]|uniref:Hydroxymethylpyrimidine/phosphomethylpyrimidine kinase n=1 Tax=Paenibacillus apiarius TaxID=46240 RepID=A0ABT4DSF0_9BACL|nr:bifunctional hydroxymethylpyrimidine kinase/phosphomethylpyrimidine kinase [Paenibacillus apiarius]MBN3523826.1 bifunctional hydroxymethylpyrimidine kinase/phosphomethylpyrimidine kinase [Paenibacillus apiarius]MCY9514141.1 bifunctional hydroxymethylpyrimidine kinase/phosphomethylpyrimidine kinase [Paenibacillus apiarius]MCY9520264.1 bifunctional hydroxymethylpyrimidine kinase/phosphomethylpyrimidine kinase [Paenibacillus apiarius]MCY9550394.1 bifunctional hydroxymethylpyrimidine kinase/phos
MTVYKALTIAGSDSGGGAGIQADIKTFQELGVFGMSAITAITVQNTLGVQAVYSLPTEAVIGQMDAIGSDLTPDAVKTGMLFNKDIIAAVADRIVHFGWKAVVVDPVMIAKGGSELLQQEAVEALKEQLLPLALVVTPNIPEAEAITGMSIRTMADRREAAKRIGACGPAYIVIKGGHSEAEEQVTDLLYDGQQFTELCGKRVHTRHTHGTGCTFSSVLAAELAKGSSVVDAVGTARAFIQAALEDTLGIGQGHGPTNHWAYGRRRAVRS